MSILVMGTVALDTVKTPHGRKEDLMGGSATHFAISANMFTQVYLAAVVGQDFPEKHLRFLQKKGISLTSLEKKAGCTFRWEGEYHEHDLNTACTLTTQLGVILDCIPRVHPTLKNQKNVFLANYDPDAQLQFLDSLNNPELVGMDTMNLWINTKRKSLRKVLRKANILIVNDAEARDLTEERNLLKAARALRAMGPKLIIIKKGEHGGLFFSKDMISALPAYPLETVKDPTGAGDTFAGAVMGYISRARKINEQIIRRAIAYGTIMSSFNVEGFGASRTAALTRKNLESRLKLFKMFFRF